MSVSMLLAHLERLCVSEALINDATTKPVKKLLTEDTGKILEYAFCKLLNTPFNGNFKYSVEKADAIANKMAPIKDAYVGYKHTGDRNNLYDFTKSDEEHISLKSVKHKNSWKVCPQIIGQTTKKKFCNKFNITDINVVSIKTYIENNLNGLLVEYLANTFHCPVLFYCEESNECMIIKLKETIKWEEAALEFLHKKKGSEWNESTTIKVTHNFKEYSLGEFQIHNHRDGVKFRFDLKTLINVFEDSFDVQKF
jgi:hypothetical protein